MAQQRRQIGNKVIAKIVDIKGNCGWGHKTGQEIEVSCHNTAGMCGFLYHEMFPFLSVVQFGGNFPWDEKGTHVVECPDRANVVKVRLQRIEEK